MQTLQGAQIEKAMNFQRAQRAAPRHDTIEPLIGEIFGRVLQGKMEEAVAATSAEHFYAEVCEVHGALQGEVVQTRKDTERTHNVLRDMTETTQVQFLQCGKVGERNDTVQTEIFASGKAEGGEGSRGTG